MPDDESALEPLLQWPNDVSQALWKSRRQLFGDPELGMADADQGAAQYVNGIEAMRSGDMDAAGKTFSEAASLGHPGALREIGDAVFHALSGPLKIASAQLFERGAEGGDARCLCWLGLLCRMNDNSSGALVNYRAADAMGDAEGSRELGILLVKTGDRDGARAALERSTDRGSASGALALGTFLANNTSHIDRAEEAFRKAADMGHPKGALNVADLVEEQRGDTEQARHFRRIALEKARQHRALMEDLEGPDYLEELQRYVNKSESPTRAGATSPGGASGSSCVLLLVAAVATAFGIAGAVWRLSSTAPRHARQIRRSLDPCDPVEFYNLAEARAFEASVARQAR